MRPSGIEPATFQFVAQHLNHCATAFPGSDYREILCLESLVGSCYENPPSEVSRRRGTWELVIRMTVGWMGMTKIVSNRCQIADFGISSTELASSATAE